MEGRRTPNLIRLTSIPLFLWATSCLAQPAAPTVLATAPIPRSTPPPTLFIPTNSPTKTPFVPTVLPIEGNPDQVLRQTLQIAKENEVVHLSDALVTRIIRTVWIDESAIIVTIGSQSGESWQTIAVVMSADCVADRFRAAGRLGEAKGGVWRPNERLNQLDATISQPYSVGLPVPIINAESITYQGRRTSCKTESAMDSLKELLNQVDWERVPENIGEKLAKIMRKFILDFKKGLTATATPAR